MVEIVKSTTATTTIAKLDKVFSEFGVPDVIRSDNRPLTVERANKVEIYISTAQEQKNLGMIGIRHDGYHVAYKLLVRYVRAILGLHQFR